MVPTLFNDAVSTVEVILAVSRQRDLSPKSSGKEIYFSESLLKSDGLLKNYTNMITFAVYTRT
jgi:hypothetical protein